MTASERVAVDAAVQILVESGEVLARSLDPATTMAEVARLTVPRLADLCVIDLRGENGTIEKVAVAAADRRVARDLESLRARFPLDPAGQHPVARVIRDGAAELLALMGSSQLRSFAQGSEHARFMVERDYRSAVVAPLTARGRTLGALSLLRLGDCEPYDEADLELGCELARRAALAIDNATLFSDLRHVEQRLEAILSNLAEAVTVVDAEGRTVFANQAAADLLLVDTPEQITEALPGSIMPRFIVLDEHGRELDLAQMPARRLFRGERPEPLLVRNIIRASGIERWLVVRASPILDGGGEVRYAVNVFEDITEVKRMQITESFMAEASRVLASSLDYGETLQQVAQLAVPRLADWCAVDVLEESGELQRVAVHHSDPRKLELALELDRAYRPALDERYGVPEVIRSGRARLFTEVGPRALAAYARDAEHLRLLSSIGATAVAIVPLAAPTRTLGAITLISAESVRRLTPADLAVAERLGRRAGTAVESARLYTERTRIANILQRALLPETLPQAPGFELAALYRAAGELNDVGGDFYDVLETGPGRCMLVIGDVCGKGPRAAGVTALARHTLRTAASLGQSPSAMLDTLHAALRAQPAGADLCTVCVVDVQRTARGARLTIALAGHPRPLIVGRDGALRSVGTLGTLLGVLDPIAISEAGADLHAGETLLLYTDGLAEAAGEAELLAQRALRGAPRPGSLSPQELLALIERSALDQADGRLRDDIALLAGRLADGPADSLR